MRPGELAGDESWARALFPEPPRSTWPRPLVGLGYVAGFALASGLALLRQPGAPATQTVWAEDGVIFYSQAVTHSFWRTLVTSYNGYDQLVPRLAVQLTRLAPIADAAAVIALCGAMGLAALACLVFHMARGHIASPALRGLLVAAMVALPLANVEMLDNLVNLPWWMFFAAFWALLWRPETRAGRWTAALVCGLAAASEPLVGLLLLLAAVRVWALPRLKEQAPTVGLVVGLVYQAAVVIGANGESSFSEAGLSGLPADFAVRVGLGWLSGLQGTNAVVSWSRPLAEAIGAAFFVGLVVAGLTFRSRQVRAFALATAVLAPLCFAAPVWLRGAGSYMQTAKSIGYAGRYAATPILMVVSAVLVLAGHLSSQRLTWAHSRRRARSHWGPQWAFIACCALLFPAWVADFRHPNGRMNGPRWQDQLSLALTRCRTENRAGLVELTIDPPSDRVILPCRDLTRGEPKASARSGESVLGRTTLEQ